MRTRHVALTGCCLAAAGILAAAIWSNQPPNPELQWIRELPPMGGEGTMPSFGVSDREKAIFESPDDGVVMILVSPHRRRRSADRRDFHHQDVLKWKRLSEAHSARAISEAILAAIDEEAQGFPDEVLSEIDFNYAARFRRGGDAVEMLIWLSGKSGMVLAWSPTAAYIWHLDGEEAVHLEAKLESLRFSTPAL